MYFGNMPLLLRALITMAAGLCTQIHNGMADFPPLSPHCFLVDVNIYYDASKIGNIDFHQTTETFKNSFFVKRTTTSWDGDPELLKKCDRTKISFDYIDYKKTSKSRELVLAATFLYEFQDGVEERLSDQEVLRCINGTRKKHDEYLVKYNWLSSIPSLKGKKGKDVKPNAAPYDMNIRHCCEEKHNKTCCPEGAMLLSGGESSFCQCKEGFHYNPDTPFFCHACPIDTYQPKPNMEFCQPCPKGTITLSKGSNSCVPLLECEEETIWENKGVFTWKNTRVNSVAEHKCPYGPENMTITRSCYWISNNKAKWAKHNSSGCNPSTTTENLLEISKTPIDDSNVNNITGTLVAETSDASELDSYDVSLATETIVNIVDYNSSLSEVAENVLKSIDNILSVDEDILAESQRLNKSTSRLLNVTEKFAENVPLRDGAFSLADINIEVTAKAITQESPNEDLTFIANSVQTNPVSSAQSQIVITGNALHQARQQGSDRVVTIVYKNNKLFSVLDDKRTSKKETNNGKESRKVGETILAGKFKGATIDSVERAVELKFPEEIMNGSTFLPHCVFWDFNANDGFGNWSTKGCQYSGTKSGHVTCTCNHMTNFAILLTADRDRDETDSDHKHALSVISYVGCGISLLAAILTLVTYLFFRDLHRSNAQTILCHLCIALIGLLVSYFVVASRDPKTTGCLVTSIVVHYFLLATFSWMAVEGINMYLAFVKVMSAHVPRFMPKAIIIAWGFPTLVVIITASIASDDYSTEESCFLHGLAFYISVFAPVVFVLFMNFMMFALTMFSLSQMGKEVSQQNKMTRYNRVKVALAVMVLLGLTWFFGTIAIGDARLTFQYLFCIFNSLQGFAIFWFHCVRQPEVRQCWADLIRGRRGRRRRYTASTTVPPLATNAVKKSSSTASPKLTPFHTRGKYNINQKTKSDHHNPNETNTV